MMFVLLWQTSAGAVSSVAVNTERHERWEAQQVSHDDNDPPT